MLSKEEIEKAKEKLKEISIETELDFVHKNIEIILEYIEQLEQEKADRISADSYENSYIAKLKSDKQKLIEKLEEDKIELTEELKYNVTKREARMQLKLVDKYLEIFK